ncbi:MAG TPA: hypothetical protein VM120_18910 [Bryobacteraceae bacterium]|nr:hypothetical protein [Bryobacteraceae bacterium]
MLKVALFALLCALALCGQISTSASEAASAGPDEFKIYTEHPRLLANARHLRLLRREKERKSLRWEQFNSIIRGKAEMPEKGFALALHYLSSQEPASGKQAIQWALGPATDLRQLALVFDWCQPLLTESQSKTLAGKLAQGMEREAGKDTVSAVRSRVLAAVALYDHMPDLPEKTLRAFWSDWWMARIVPAIRKNRDALPRTDAYALLEIMHAIRDNLNFDMRDNALAFFKDFPLHRVLSYYPAVFPAAENHYRIPMYAGLGEPDLSEAALSRAADLSIVAFDGNALENQFLQGWLIQDNFLMRGAFGITYEFLWANPYQPGLSYHHLPNFFHDPKSGVLFLRSSWEENASWLSYRQGQMELFLEGKRTGLQPRAIKEPLQVGDHIVMVGESPMRFTLNLGGQTRYFLIGLRPATRYEVEVDDEELREMKTDAGGILALAFPESLNVGVRLKEYQP